MAKKLGKLIFWLTLMGIALAGAIAYFNNKLNNEDEWDDDFDEFEDEFEEEDLDETSSASREYVSIPKENQTEDELEADAVKTAELK